MRLRHLSPGSITILRTVIDAIRPRGHGFDQPIDDDVLVEIDRSLGFLPGPLRASFPAGLRLLEWLAPLLVLHRPARLTGLQRAEARRVFEGWLRSRVGPFRSLTLGLRALVFLAFYQHPDVLAAMEVRWAERAEETIRLRAETLGNEDPHVPSP